MLSGQLVPSSATNNFEEKSEYIIEDENTDYQIQLESKSTEKSQKYKNKSNSKEISTVISSATKSQTKTTPKNNNNNFSTENIPKTTTPTKLLSNCQSGEKSTNTSIGIIRNKLRSGNGNGNKTTSSSEETNGELNANNGNNSQNIKMLPSPSPLPQQTSNSTSATNTTTTVPPTIVTNNPKDNSSSSGCTSNNNFNDATGRSAALERAYVHDVYENCEEPTGPIRPRVAQFLAGLEPGSIVCDVGCGNGRYLTACNPFICTIGVDRCYRLAKVAKEKGGEVALCDNLDLPFRDESFDAVLSLAVVHHFATTERRVGAIRELARILRIGGRVIISVWALEQRHRRFESQDVLIPWQPPKNRTVNYSDEEDEDEFLPPYHAYTEDSTNSSRSAGDGDSSSLSSSSPGESCYSFVRRAIQKLAGGRKHPWFLESWNSKDTKNDSSLDYEDAKDLPIELRRLEDFEDFPEPPLSAGLKSRSLGSILNPPPRQIVRSRSSVPSLGGVNVSQQIFFPEHNKLQNGNNSHLTSSITSSQPHLLGIGCGNNNLNNGDGLQQQNISPTKSITSNNGSNNSGGPTSTSGTPTLGRRPKLIKQKQSLCDDEYQLPDNPFNMLNSNNNINNINSSSNSNSNQLNSTNNSNLGTGHMNLQTKLFQKQFSDSRLLLRKQSSLNEELMAENRLREKERVRKRIQKQMSLNEAFLCRSVFTKRLQIIREGFTTKLKTSTGSLERVTKNGLVKIMKNFQSSQFSSNSTNSQTTSNNKGFSPAATNVPPSHNKYATMSRKNSCQNSLISGKLAMQHCIAAGTHSTSGGICSNCNNGSGGSGSGGSSNSSNSNDDQSGKPRRHSRESGSDSSKDSSLQSDTSIESEDSFASVIFIPKPDNQHQHQQQLKYQQQHSYNHSSSSGSGNGTTCNCLNTNNNVRHYCNNSNTNNKLNYIIPSVPTSPLIMPCPPTPAHSPAAQTSNNCNNGGIINSSSVLTSPPLQLVSGMLLSPPNLNMQANFINNDDEIYNTSIITNNFDNIQGFNRFTFDEEHILAQHQQKIESQKPEKIEQIKSDTGKQLLDKSSEKEITIKKLDDDKIIKKDKSIEKSPSPILSNTGAVQKKSSPKITRQAIKDLPPIPKFRRHQSLHLSKSSFPIVRRASAAPSVPRLQSLELFNPATDDLDSDSNSSEPSSPDSIDSVIDARPSDTSDKDKIELKKSNETNNDLTSSKVKLQQTKQYHSLDLPNLSSNSLELNKPKKSDSLENNNKNDESYISKYSLDMKNELIKANQEILSRYSNNKDNLFINNLDIKNNQTSDIKNINSNSYNDLNTTTLTKSSTSRQELVDFAEQLSAQLLKRLDADRKKNKFDDSPPQPDGDSGTYSSSYMDEFNDEPYIKTSSSSYRQNNDIRDLTEWREELRERRLNLANLSTQTSQKQSPISSSTSSLSSQTARSYTIHEEDEDAEAADSSTGYSSSTAPSQLNYYENRINNKNIKYKRNNIGGNYSSSLDYRNYSIYPDTAYLIQDNDGDSLSREDDDYDDIEHNNVILEEDEDELEHDENVGDDEDELGDNEYSKRTSRNTIRCQDSIESPIIDVKVDVDVNNTACCSRNLNDNNNTTTATTTTTVGGGNNNCNGGGQESWALSNSSNSLDSPSQSGGSTTHHRYYHVFREGELDALINHHVASLHIVSSYYERASWCVVAEKVQVWTI